MNSRARLETVGERPALRMERRLADRPERVWQAITEPSKLAKWFPAAVTVDLRPGGKIEFSFEGEEAPTAGKVLEADEPRVFVFSWNDDVLRWEITPDGDGSRLLFTHTFGRGEPAIAKIAAPRTAAGWDSCLVALVALLDGVDHEPSADWIGPIEAYTEEFGLAEGEVLETGDGKVIRFRRDLVWKPLDEVWARLTAEPAEGTVIHEEPPRLLEFSLPRGGIVRWEFSHSELDGTMVEVTQTVPAGQDDIVPEALRSRREKLKKFFAATQGS
ncbi:SRPBCC family protein [Amycolatopsis coloradensis]|uniref:SRPBCC family protein n=1 Tax=Amycolatopsis coloradensis TaxID=76021 RepID=A0ACD5BR85_9PSEU